MENSIRQLKPFKSHFALNVSRIRIVCCYPHC